MNVSAATTEAEVDVKGSVSAEEWETRVNLAACYRMIAHLGWDDLVFTHISARVPGPEHHFLINPYGYFFEEVTASNLVKVDLDGNKVMPSPHEINPAGYNIHSAIHAVREDAQCIIHLHTPEGVAVSCLKDGLTRLSQTSLYTQGSLAYHPYEGVALEEDERPRLQADLGKKKLMILENHGLLTCGRTVAAAFLSMFTLQRACQIQVMAQSTGAELIGISDDIMSRIARQSRQSLGNNGANLVWPAVMRKMDRLDPSYRD